MSNHWAQLYLDVASARHMHHVAVGTPAAVDTYPNLFYLLLRAANGGVISYEPDVKNGTD